MLDFLAYYSIFAVATAITSCCFFFWPVLKLAKTQGISNEVTRSPLLSVCTYTAIAAIGAPIQFVILAVPSFSENYKRGMYSVICQEK